MNQEQFNRLQQIQEEMLELLEEAEYIVRYYSGNDLFYERAKGYWIAHIKTALTNEHEYIGGSMMTMEDTLNELDSGNSVDEDESEDGE